VSGPSLSKKLMVNTPEILETASEIGRGMEDSGVIQKGAGAVAIAHVLEDLVGEQARLREIHGMTGGPAGGNGVKHQGHHDVMDLYVGRVFPEGLEMGNQKGWKSQSCGEEA